MTNFEYWKNELAEIAKTDDDIGILHGKPVECNDVGGCENCDRDGRCNEAALINWLMEEHVEKSKLTRRERCFCEVFYKGWLVKDEVGRLYYYSERPVKKIGGWTAQGGISYCFDVLFRESHLEGLCFSMIKISDPKPWSVEDLLKLEVE